MYFHLSELGVTWFVWVLDPSPVLILMTSHLSHCCYRTPLSRWLWEMGCVLGKWEEWNDGISMALISILLSLFIANFSVWSSGMHPSFSDPGPDNSQLHSYHVVSSRSSLYVTARDAFNSISFFSFLWSDGLNLASSWVLYRQFW